ncbi:MAG: hypothetical protein WCC95_17495 [Candidatus Sulfotelmatobacter sp.]
MGEAINERWRVYLHSAKCGRDEEPGKDNGGCASSGEVSPIQEIERLREAVLRLCDLQKELASKVGEAFVPFSPVVSNGVSLADLRKVFGKKLAV